MMTDIGRYPLRGSGLRPFGAEPQDASQAEPLVPNAAFLPAISMWQPYASLMFVWDRERGEFAKANETRSHRLPDRLINEWVVIHATAKFAPDSFLTEALTDLCYDMFGCGYNYSLPRGAAVGRVRFGVPVPTDELAPFQPDSEIAAGDWTPGRWAWPVMEAELFAMPVPMKGAQGWWRCPIRDEDAAALQERPCTCPPRPGGDDLGHERDCPVNPLNEESDTVRHSRHGYGHSCPLGFTGHKRQHAWIETTRPRYSARRFSCDFCAAVATESLGKTGGAA